MTAAALLTVVGVTILMQLAGLSASLGAFIAGALLAEFLLPPRDRGRHPAVRGAAARAVLHRHRHVAQSAAPPRGAGHHPGAGGRAGRHQDAGASTCSGAGRGWSPDLRAASVWRSSQGGEFAFVLFTVGYAAGALTSGEHRAADHRRHAVDGGDAAPAQARQAAVPPPQGTGARLRNAARERRPRDHRRLRPRRPDRRAHPDRQAHPVHGARHQTPSRSSSCAGSAPRPSTATPAGRKSWRRRTRTRRAPSCSPSTTSKPPCAPPSIVRQNYPDVPIYARARNRHHAHRLLDLGVTNLQRETFLSSLDMTKQLLKGLGVSEREAERLHPYLPHARRAPPDRGLQSSERPRQAARAGPQRRKDPGKALRGGCCRGRAPARGRAARGGLPVKPIICVGHAALDYVYRIEAFPPEPTKVRSFEHIESGGGMAANAAAAIARLGGQVELWSRIGGDSAGQRILWFLKADGVDTQLRAHVRGRALFDLGGHRRRQRRAADHRRARPRHVHGFELAAVGAHRRGRGGAQRPALGRGYARCFRRGRARGACRLCSMPISAAAACSASSCASPTTRYSPDQHSTNSRPAWMSAPSSRACWRWACATPASRAGPTATTWLSKSGSTGHQPGFAAEVVDTTGAGDAFHGAFAWALADGRPAGECARIAAAVAALKCRKLGARAGLPTRAELDEFLAVRVD